MLTIPSRHDQELLFHACVTFARASRSSEIRSRSPKALPLHHVHDHVGQASLQSFILHPL
jgi:hypothetical protein